jgi:hypothetical protein
MRMNGKEGEDQSLENSKRMSSTWAALSGREEKRREEKSRIQDAIRIPDLSSRSAPSTERVQSRCSCLTTYVYRKIIESWESAALELDTSGRWATMI